MSKLIIISFMMMLTNSAWCDEKTVNLNCSNVIPVIEKTEYKKVIAAIEKDINKHSHNTSVSEVRLINRAGRWYVVDASFNNLDPAIFVLYRGKNGIHIIEELSGDISENNQKETKDVIVDYFVSHVPKAPKELIRCSVSNLAKFWSN